MRTLVQIAVVAILALGVHLALGWVWTLGVGGLGGVFMTRRGWLVSMLGVAFDWAVLVGYNYVAAPAATQTMVDTMGGILGNTSGMAVVAGTILIGMLLGGVSGAVGTFARQAVRPAA
mgnify:CR=1 FL=1